MTNDNTTFIPSITITGGPASTLACCCCGTSDEQTCDVCFAGTSKEVNGKGRPYRLRSTTVTLCSGCRAMAADALMRSTGSGEALLEKMTKLTAENARLKLHLDEVKAALEAVRRP